jgi:hypothetical protein
VKWFDFVFELYLLMNLLLLIAVFFSKFRDYNNYHFISKTLIEHGIRPEWFNLVESFLFVFITESIIYSFMHYIRVYVFIFQAFQHLKRHFDLLMGTRHLSEKQFLGFWHRRLQLLELRRRTQDLYGLIAFIFFSSMFVVTSLYILSLTILRPANMFMFIVLYVVYFAVPTMLSTQVLGNLTEADELLNFRLFDFLNDLPMHLEHQASWNESHRKSYLNHVRAYSRIPITAWKVFEINRKLPIHLINISVSFVVMAYNYL